MGRVAVVALSPRVTVRVLLVHAPAFLAWNPDEADDGGVKRRNISTKQTGLTGSELRCVSQKMAGGSKKN